MKQTNGKFEKWRHRPLAIAALGNLSTLSLSYFLCPPPRRSTILLSKHPIRNAAREWNMRNFPSGVVGRSKRGQPASFEPRIFMAAWHLEGYCSSWRAWPLSSYSIFLLSLLLPFRNFSLRSSSFACFLFFRLHRPRLYGLFFSRSFVFSFYSVLFSVFLHPARRFKAQGVPPSLCPFHPL